MPEEKESHAVLIAEITRLNAELKALRKPLVAIRVVDGCVGAVWSDCAEVQIEVFDFDESQSDLVFNTVELQRMWESKIEGMTEVF